MELKSYQKKIIEELQRYLTILEEGKDLSTTFRKFWNTHATPLHPFPGKAIEPYKDTIKGVPHVCIKVPTAGGKTFIACNSLSVIFRNLGVIKDKLVVWLVPSVTIKEQTLKNLTNPDHPYRQRICSDFNSKVNVISKEQALSGQDFCLSSVSENLTIIVASFDSFRSNTKENRNVYQDNGNLIGFKSIESINNPESDEEISLVDVIQKLRPVVIVDESHNAETTLSKEMLEVLQPRFILDLTATPRSESNIISFTDAMELKKENMVKLPVIVYNQNDKNDVITSALHLQRKLEELSKKQAKSNKKNFIRPIVLFQAEPKSKDDSTTFDDIKTLLLKKSIPEEQIKIKIASKDELKDIDLMAKDCPVRYIITVNALKEGWDCPNAYILATIANKSSVVDVTQILGRVLRLPYVRKNEEDLLNMSYVLTCSSAFFKTLDSVVAGLNNAGFSDQDYRVAKPEPEVEKPKTEEIPVSEPTGISNTPNAIENNPISTVQTVPYTPQPNENEPSDEELNPDKVDFDGGDINVDTAGKTNEETETTTVDGTADNTGKSETDENIKDENTKKETEVEEPNPYIQEIIDKANEENSKTEELIENEGVEQMPIEIKGQVSESKMNSSFEEIAKQIRIPKFIRDTGFNSELFGEKIVDVGPETFLSGFELSKKDNSIDISKINSSMYKVDLSITNDKHTPEYKKLKNDDRDKIVDYVLSAEHKGKMLTRCIELLRAELGDFKPIAEKEINLYLKRVIENFDIEIIKQIARNSGAVAKKINDKIKQLSDEYKMHNFYNMVESDKIVLEPSYTFPSKKTFLQRGNPIEKSLYEYEESFNTFEAEIILEVASYDNVVFWTRNRERKDFCINGFINHYPDFIIKTKKNLILLETKGDHLIAENKIELGNKWAEIAGKGFKYYLVYDERDIQGAYTKDKFLNLLKDL